MMQKALEQAKEQFEHASDEQKAMYEERLQEMVERVRQVEEREQRARSMAEQTTKGHVYIISNIGSFGEDVYEIGLTRRWDRLIGSANSAIRACLSDSTYMPRF
jgi:hypothetical protein